MTTSPHDLLVPCAVSARVDNDALVVELSDGRSVSTPLAWYPRLLNSNAAERSHLKLTGGGRGIHWPDIDEDISVDSILAGRPSMESPASLKRWLTIRAKT